MLRNIIQIDEEKCTGCGLCAKAVMRGPSDSKTARQSSCVTTTATALKLPAGLPDRGNQFRRARGAEYDEAAGRKT
jgi:ferredoxin